MGIHRVAGAGVSFLLGVSMVAGCAGGADSPLAGCGSWMVDSVLAASELADFEFLNEQRAASREELESIVIDTIEATLGLDELALLVDDTEEVEASLLPDFTKATVGDDKPFPPKPDWLVAGTGDSRWAVVLHDDALGNAPLDARLDEGWYILGEVYTASCS